MTDEPYLAQVLLNTARSAMNVPREELVGTWPRVSAVLARQALELELARYWTRVSPGVESASMRAQLLCLGELDDPELANRARYVWHALSNACHHLAYDLPPTESELSSWLDDVSDLLAHLRAP